MCMTVINQFSVLSRCIRATLVVRIMPTRHHGNSKERNGTGIVYVFPCCLLIHLSSRLEMSSVTCQLSLCQEWHTHIHTQMESSSWSSLSCWSGNGPELRMRGSITTVPTLYSSEAAVSREKLNQRRKWRKALLLSIFWRSRHLDPCSISQLRTREGLVYDWQLSSALSWGVWLVWWENDTMVQLPSVTVPSELQMR